MWIFLSAQGGIAALFLACVWQGVRDFRLDGGQSLSRLGSAAIFAWVFEELNVLGGWGRGSYFYHPRFVMLDQVPLFIVLAWAVILWGAMRLSDGASLRQWQRVACDASLAVLLDLSFDATAIRYRFWFWRGVGFDEAWFGVPAGNFFGWLWVSLAFSLLTRALWHLKLRRDWRAIGQMLLVPPLGLLLYRALEKGANRVLLALNFDTDKRSMAAFFAIFFLVAACALWPKRHEVFVSAPPIVPWSRLAFHAFSIIGLLLLPAFAQKLALLIIALLVLLADWLFARALRAKPLIAHEPQA